MNAKAFEKGPPHGFRPSVGDKVLFLHGCTPRGPVITTETVTSAFEWQHWSGSSHWAFALSCGVTCGVNSLRPGH